MKKVTLFLSCVSDEFHKEDKAADPQFSSWRTHLEHHLNGLERAEFVIITQESALQNEQGDLLEILEQVVERSDYVVHLYGDLPGESPAERSLRRLRERRPDFLHHEPEILKALPEWQLISYNQWELYFAFHHRRSHPLIYFVEDDVPRSPASRDRRGSPEALASRDRHMQVVRATGQLRPRLRNRDHLALSVQTYLLKQGAFEPEGWVRSTAAMLTSARANLSLLLPRIAHRLGVGRGPTSGGARPVKPVQYLEAVEAIAEEAGVRAAEFVSILEEDLEQRWNQALKKPRFAEFHGLALTWLALGDLLHARLAARQAADHALRRMNEAPQPEVREKQRENALNALLLLHDIAHLDHDITAAIHALTEGSPLMDYHADPLAWADYHMLMASYAYDKGYFEEALTWLWGQAGTSDQDDSASIIDAYEKAFGREIEAEETEPRLAYALKLLAQVYSKHGEAARTLPIIRRARRIYGRHGAQGLFWVSQCLLHESVALQLLSRTSDALTVALEAEWIISEIQKQNTAHESIEYHLGSILSQIGSIYRTLEQHENALEFLTRSLKIDEALAVQNPGNTYYRHVVGLSLGSIGNSYQSLEQHENALEFLTRSLEVCESLASQEPSNVHYRYERGILLGSIGNSYHDLEQHEKALEFQTRSLEISEALAAQEPSNASYRKHVCFVLGSIGRSHHDLEQHEKALEFLTRSLKISEALAAQEPSNANYRRDEGISLSFIGRSYQALEQHEKALEFLTHSLVISEALASQEPGNANYRKDVDTALHYIGRSHQALGHHEKALEFLTRSLAIHEALAAQELGNTSYLSSEGILLSSIGRSYQALGQHKVALDFLTRSLAIHEALSELEPDQSSHQYSVGRSINYIGSIQQALGQYEKALELQTRSLEICEFLASQEPANASYRYSVSNSLKEIGCIHQDLERHEKALEFLTLSLEINESLAEQELNNANYGNSMAISLHYIGRSHQALGQHKKALEFQTRALEISEALAAQEPGNASYRREVGISLYYIGRSHAEMGAYENALEFLTRALEIYEGLAAQEPNHFEYQRGLYLGHLQKGRALRNLGQTEAAKHHLQLAWDIAESLAKTSYRNAKMPKEQADIQTELSLLEA